MVLFVCCGFLVEHQHQNNATDEFDVSVTAYQLGVSYH